MKKTIYERQMHELNLNIEQYAKLLNTPLFIVRKLLKGEKLSEDMGLNEFLRNNILNKYNELEKNNVETKAKATEIKINDKEENKEEKVDLLEWYKNEFDKNVLMEKFNCYKESSLLKKMPLMTEQRYLNGRLFTNDKVISVSTFNRLMNKKSLGEEYLMSLLKQLYDYYTKDEIETPQINNAKKSKYIEWWESFNLPEWLVEKNLPVSKFTKETHIGHGSYYNLIKENYVPTLSTLMKIKDYVDKKENGEIIEEDINQEILDWYENEFTKEKLLEKTNCKTIGEFYQKYKIIIKRKRASRWFYFGIVGKNTRNIREEVISEFATQLKEILEGNKSKYRDYCFKEGVKPKDSLQEWWLNFNFKKFLDENNISNIEFLDKVKMPKSTFFALKAKRKDLGDKWLEEIKKYVESFEDKEMSEPIEVLDLEPVEEFVPEGQISIYDYEDVSNSEVIEFDSNSYVKGLIKNTLTPKEKWLIELFGGRID